MMIKVITNCLLFVVRKNLLLDKFLDSEKVRTTTLVNNNNTNMKLIYELSHRWRPISTAVDSRSKP